VVKTWMDLAGGPHRPYFETKSFGSKELFRGSTERATDAAQDKQVNPGWEGTGDHASVGVSFQNNPRPKKYKVELSTSGFEKAPRRREDQRVEDVS